VKMGGVAEKGGGNGAEYITRGVHASGAPQHRPRADLVRSSGDERFRWLLGDFGEWLCAPEKLPRVVGRKAGVSLDA
jgi:hypothetical protein